jgi:deoxycytidine triphosphate deaminase
MIASPPAAQLTEAQAKALASRYLDVDPHPNVPRSLLSSSEIAAYAKSTAMLHPFYEENLKSASYEIHLQGRVISWDAKGQRSDKNVNRGQPIVLSPNSITFVQVESKFYLPNYIAIRFNLRITHVHRGLLLGTGPLVDPGFEGRLLIPLHNLTATEYVLDTNVALIWVEFTKTSFNYNGNETDPNTPRTFKDVPPIKKNMTPDEYLYKANSQNPIRSSIPDVIADAKEMAKDAHESSIKSANAADISARSAESTQGYVKRLALGGAVGLLVGVTGAVAAMIALYLSAYSLMQNYESLATTRLTPVISDQSGMSDRLKIAQSNIEKLNQQVATPKVEIDNENKTI